jgi:metallopeptidase MepB
MPLQPLPRILGADEIIPTLTRHVDAHRKLIDNITENINVSTSCFENVIRPLVELENVQAGEKAVIDALKYCSPNLECQHTVDKGEAMWQEYSSNKRRDLYILVKAVKDRGEKLDYESQKLLDRILLEYEEHGYGSLDDDGIQCRRERMNRIEELCAQFHRNLREYNGGEWFTPEELDGVPKKDREPTGPDGKEFYSYNSKHMTIMRNARNPETRRRWLLARQQRFAKNVPIFREVILLRDENAREIGITSHAATKIPYRTVESTKWVDELMTRLMDTLLPHSKVEFERVKDMKQRCLLGGSTTRDGNGTKLMPWDFIYYGAMLNKEVQVDHAAIAEYFPLRHTVSAMFDIFADCLQLRFEPIPKEELRKSIWYDDVEAWVVSDERLETKGDFIGFLFADLLGRPNKYKGNQSVNLQPVRFPLLSLCWN